MKPRKPIRKVSAKQRARISLRRKIRERRWKERTKWLICHICNEPIYDFYDYVLDHEIPSSATRDDSEENLKDSHSLCNMLKGSRRNFSLDT